MYLIIWNIEAIVEINEFTFGPQCERDWIYVQYCEPDQKLLRMLFYCPNDRRIRRKLMDMKSLRGTPKMIK